MVKFSVISKSVLLAGALACGACASSPQAPEVQFAEEELRETDNDVLFATEFPVASKEEAIERAKAAEESGDIDKAVFFYVKALNFDPRDAALLAKIGLLHQFKGDPEMAVRAYTLALNVDPNFAAVLEARGLILLAHNEDDRAEKDLLAAVQINPDLWRTHEGLGILWDRRGDHGLALSHYDQAAALFPNGATILNNRGYSKLLGGDFEGAEADLSRAAIELGHDQAWVNLGTLFARRREYNKAVDAYEAVLPHAQALNKVAEVSISNGDLEQAKQLLEQAIRISPRFFPEAEENLAQVLLMAGSAE